MMLTSAKAEITEDKLMHAGVGIVIWGGCIALGQILENSYLNYKTCLIPVVVAGVGKEIYDHQHPESHTSEWQDAAATVLIPLTATIVIYKW